MNRTQICKQYNQIYEWFDNSRTKTLIEKDYLEFISKNLPEPAQILDLGCGTGEPIAEFFIHNGHHITGIDGSNNMIALCKKRFPSHTWICADMRDITLHKSFDVILAWNSFFHLPHDDQRNMFPLFQAHAKPGSYLLFTAGPSHGDVTSTMNELEFYHASLSEQEYRALLEKQGYTVLQFNIEDKHCGDHTVCLAQYQSP